MTTRALRNGEPIQQRTAAELGDADLGRIVQTPGHRGTLRGIWTDPDGLRAVCTTAGVAHYPPSAPFLVWGP